VLREKFAELERLLLSHLRSFYGDRLVSVAVFGSVARETQNFFSDLDLLIVARDLPGGRIKRIRQFEAVEEKVAPFLKSLQKDGIYTDLSAILKTPAEVEQGSPLFLDMVEDARIVFDRDGFFAAVLEKLRKRLTELGAKRVWQGNAWYWILKPDLRPGEVFEL
jgi:predicted nucleotidyltransferase